MKLEIHYLQRSTILLLISLVAVIATAVWSGQYLAIRNQTISEQSTSIKTEADVPIVQSVPEDSLVHERVLTLQSTPKSSYAEQVVGKSTGALTPDVPDFTATNTQLGNGVLLSWYNQERTETYDGIIIYRSVDAMSSGEPIATVTTVGDGTYLDTTVAHAQSYYYTIQTFRTADTGEKITSALSSVYPVVVADTIAPNPPTAVTVTTAEDDAQALVIQWQNAVTDDVEKNAIYRSTIPGQVGEKLVTVPGVDGRWQDTSITDNQTYYYTVSAIDAAGNESSVDLPVAPYGNANPFVASGQEISSQ